MHLTLTHSAIERYMTCPRAYELSYVFRLKPAGDDQVALVLGSAYHAAVQHRCALDRAAAVIAASTLTPEQKEKATAVVTAMLHVVSTPPDVKEAETRLRKRLTTRTVVAGSRDWLTPDGIGGEAKTTSDTLDDAQALYLNSIQIPLYMWMDPRPFVLWLAKKPTTRTRQGESVAEWMQRAIAEMTAEPAKYWRTVEVPYDEGRCLEACDQARWVARAINHCSRTCFGRKYGAGCKTPYGWCEYKPFCWYHDDSRYVTAEVEHTELA